MILTLTGLMLILGFSLFIIYIAFNAAYWRGYKDATTTLLGTVEESELYDRKTRDPGRMGYCPDSGCAAESEIVCRGCSVSPVNGEPGKVTGGNE
jgi:hypothetical protein